jgi:hypothetical protein
MTQHRNRRPYVWALALLWALPAVAFSAWILTAPDHNPDGQCEGIGFGCTLTPHDGAVFLAMLSAPLLLLVGGLVCLVIWAVQRGRDRASRRGPDSASGTAVTALSPPVAAAAPSGPDPVRP